MMVFYIVIAVLVLLFGIFSYLNAANWNVLHALGLFLTFCAAFAYLVLAAAALKTESAWKKTAEQKLEELAAQKAKVEKLEHGFSIDPRTGRLQLAESNIDSLDGSTAELERAMYDRGQVWRNVGHGKPNNNQIPLTFPPIRTPEPADGSAPAAATAPAERSLAVDDLIYAFGQMPLPGQNPSGEPNQPVITVPAYFIGEFVVRSVNGANVTVESTTKLDTVQQQLIGLQNPWMLYDQMPTDEHEVFEEMEDEEIATLIRGACQRLDLPKAAADELIANFQRTGELAGNEDPELAVLTKVTFQQDYEVPVDTETETTGVTQEFEPASGLAAAEYLKQGAPTQFKKGQEVILSTLGERGKSLIDQGIVKVEEKVYVRPLNDFVYQFHAFKAQVEELAHQKFVLEQTGQMLTEALQIATNLVNYRTQEKDNLQSDKTKLVYEQEQISEYKTRLMDYLTETLKKNSELYRTNQTLVEELKRASDEILKQLQEQQRASQSDSELTLAN